jgi:hypothetical protein
VVTVDDAKSAKEAWKALEDIYQSNSAAQLQRTLRDFNTLKLQTAESITDYIAHPETIRGRLTASKQIVTDESFTMTLLFGLPATYTAVSTYIENVTPLPKLPDVQGMLLRAEEKLKTEQPEGRRDNDDNAFNATTKTGCHYCGRKGHYYKECRKRIADEKNVNGVTKMPKKSQGYGGAGVGGQRVISTAQPPPHPGTILWQGCRL